MFFWIPALIPLIAAFAILVSPLWPISTDQRVRKYERRKNLQRFGIYLGLSIALSVIVCLTLWFGATAKTRFMEVWHFHATEALHEMEWTTEETRTETYTTGTGKNQQTHTRIVHYTAHHGPYFHLTLDDGRSVHISESDYMRAKSYWGNEKQTGVHRGSAAGFGRKIDGPIYECTWPRSFETIYPYPEFHSYVNKVRVGDSVLRFGTPTETALARYPRPADKRNADAILNYSGHTFTAADQLTLNRVNARLGPQYQIHTLLVVFPMDAGRGVVDDVLAAWGGPNKNELVTFVALDADSTVVWCDVQSWMDDTTLHATLRDALQSEWFSVDHYADLLMDLVPKMWSRKHFTPINEYLSVPLNPWWAVSAFVVVVFLSVAMFFVVETITDGEHPLRNPMERFLRRRRGARFK